MLGALLLMNFNIVTHAVKGDGHMTYICGFAKAERQ